MATCVLQSSSDELSTPVAVKRIRKVKLATLVESDPKSRVTPPLKSTYTSHGFSHFFILFYLYSFTLNLNLILFFYFSIIYDSQSGPRSNGNERENLQLAEFQNSSLTISLVLYQDTHGALPAV